MKSRIVDSDRFPGVGIDRADVELVPPAQEVDIGGPVTGGAGRHPVRIAPRRRDRDRSSGQRRSAQSIRRRRRATSRTAVAGSVTDEGRRLRETQDLDAEIRAKSDHDDRQQRDDDHTGRERHALPWSGDGSGGADKRNAIRELAALPRRPLASLAAPLAQGLVGVEAEVQRVVAQEAFRVDPARAGPRSRRVPARRDSAPGSWSRAQPDRGRRPCASRAAYRRSEQASAPVRRTVLVRRRRDRLRCLV